MAEKDRIATTNTVLENPRIKQSGVTTIKTFSAEQRTEEFDRYWADVDMGGKRRKLFPVEFWQLDALIKKTGHIAFIVRNIHNANKVTAKWAVYDDKKPPALKENDRCFVLSKKYFDGEIKKLEIETISHSINGLAAINRTNGLPNFIVALVGKNTKGADHVFFQNATPNLLEEDPGGVFDTNPGGEGTGGIRIP